MSPPQGFYPSILARMRLFRPPHKIGGGRPDRADQAMIIASNSRPVDFAVGNAGEILDHDELTGQIFREIAPEVLPGLLLRPLIIGRDDRDHLGDVEAVTHGSAASSRIPGAFA